jgi:two-component system, NarL family, response regulator NreC
VSESKTTIVLADDHAVVRSGLRMLLDAEPDLNVAAEADTVEETVRKLLAYKPDVLVLDINMGGEMSLSALPQMLEASPGTRVVVLTMEAETAYAREALRAGATGYLLKEAADSELVEAVRRAAGGESYVQPSIGARLASDPEEQWPPAGLSEREAEVLRLIALGHTNKEIGEQLYLSVRTVESHRAHIQQKLQLDTRAELVRFALDHDMLDGAGGAGAPSPS